MLVYNNTKSPTTIFKKKGGSTRFMVGSNEVSKSDWEEFSKNKMVKIYIESGELSLKKSDSITTGQKVAVGITDLAESKAIKLVEECFDLPTLEKWYKADSRKKVKGAITSQIKEIKK